MISAFESRSDAFPKYEDRTVFKSANLNERKHFIEKKQELSTIVWESNLRSSALLKKL